MLIVDVKKRNGCWCQERKWMLMSRKEMDVDVKNVSESVRNYPDANMATVPRALNAGNSI